jgi:hypothetical protein
MKQALVGIRGGARISAEGIMASGHVNHTNRPHTWLHRPTYNVNISLANSEPSTHGTQQKRRTSAQTSVTNCPKGH